MVLLFSVTSSPKLSEDSASFNTNLTPKNIELSLPSTVDNIIPIVEPVDYENYYYQNHNCEGSYNVDHDDPLMEFPEGSNDVDVYVLPRKVRTLIPAGPEEDM